jgi:hypothetical protein
LTRCGIIGRVDEEDDAPLPAAEEQRDEEEGAASSRDERGRFTQGNAFRFPPGTSGNPAGRSSRLDTMIDRVIAEEVETQTDLGKREALELMVRSLVRTALRGGSSGTSAFRELMDRRFGRVPMSVRLGPEVDEGPRAIEITVVRRGDVDAQARSMATLIAPALAPGNGNGNGNGNA